MQKVRVFVDAAGGDHAPEAAVLGSLEALRNDPSLLVSLGGLLSAVEPYLSNAEELRGRIDLVNTPENISNHESPAIAIRQKKQSAIVKGMLALREQEADAFVSAGSTGAVLLGGMLRLGRIHGIERPALAPLIPNGKGHFLLIDCGANVDCKPEYLVQFGLMGDAYMRRVRKLEQPRVGLINVGDESEKGNALTKAAFPLMETSPYHFVGNVEARYLLSDTADVMVCDGFDGNLILKYTEGLAGGLLGMIRQELSRDLRSKIGGLLAKPAFKRVKRMMDYNEVGGAPLLGVKGVVVKAHGSSNARAFASAIRQAADMARSGLVQSIEEQLGPQNPIRGGS